MKPRTRGKIGKIGKTQEVSTVLELELGHVYIDFECADGRGRR